MRLALPAAGSAASRVSRSAPISTAPLQSEVLQSTVSAAIDSDPGVRDRRVAGRGRTGQSPARSQAARLAEPAFSLAVEGSADGADDYRAIGAFSAAEEQAEATILARLADTVSLRCKDHPLADVIEDLSVGVGVTIGIDHRALDDAGSHGLAGYV